MNKALMEARRRFRGQKGAVRSGYDNSPIPEGKYTCKVMLSEVSDKDVDEVKRPCHKTRLSIELGDHKGRSLWPFPPLLDEQDGILQCASNLRAILGEVLPGKKLRDGSFELDYGQFLDAVEGLVARIVGELIEVNVKNGKTLKDDGTPWQNTYINRGLGDDKAGVPSKNAPAEEATAHDLRVPKRRKKA